MDGLYGIISVSADPVSFKYCWTKKLWEWTILIGVFWEYLTGHNIG